MTVDDKGDRSPVTQWESKRQSNSFCRSSETGSDGDQALASTAGATADRVRGGGVLAQALIQTSTASNSNQKWRFMSYVKPGTR